ncbi:hypothetical protein [Mucilaginibacter sp.]|nr:hypothetical protein [Mucilaginibacter sp.]
MNLDTGERYTSLFGSHINHTLLPASLEFASYLSASSPARNDEVVSC